MNIINDIFDKLDDWRNLPSYQLERRADIFFSSYLKIVLEAKFHKTIKGQIIPEFPIHIRTIYPHIQSDKSFKIDYLAFTEDNSECFFIELKTDDSSRREKQDNYLNAASNAGMTNLIQGLIKIFQATNAKRKYFYLFKILENAGIIRLPDQLQQKVFSENQTGINVLISKIQVIQQIEHVSVLYLQPNGQGENVITFSEFANFVSVADDDVAHRFCESLRKWGSIKAGDYQ